MIRKHALVAAALLGSAIASAQAADFFAGASVGRSHFHVDDFPGVSIDRNDTGFKVFGGASFTPNLGLEAGYVNLGKVKASAGSATGSLRGTGFYVDAVGEFPVGGNFSVLAKIGAFRGEAKAEVPTVGSDKDTGTDFKFGLGGAYAIDKNLSVRAEWERYRFNVFDDKGDTDLISVGISYKF